MKRVLITLMLLLAVAVFAGCGSSQEGSESPSSDASVDSLKTIGDIIALEPSDTQWGTVEDTLVYAFQLGDTYYRAKAALPAETSDALAAVDFSAEDYEDQQKKILEPLEITEVENLSEQILPQEELDKFVGKTGQEMMDAGWTFSGHDLETMEFWMNKGPFLYTVVFDGQVAEADYETFEDESGTKDMKVKSVVYQSIGDATNLEN